VNEERTGVSSSGSPECLVEVLLQMTLIKCGCFSRSSQDSIVPPPPHTPPPLQVTIYQITPMLVLTIMTL